MSKMRLAAALLTGCILLSLNSAVAQERKQTATNQDKKNIIGTIDRLDPVTAPRRGAAKSPRSLRADWRSQGRPAVQRTIDTQPVRQPASTWTREALG